MSKDSFRPARRQLAAEIHEEVRTDGPSIDGPSDGDIALPNLSTVDGPDSASESGAIVQSPGPLTLSSATAADGTVSAFFGLDTPTGEAGDLEAAAIELHEDDVKREVQLQRPAGSKADVVFVFDDAGSMYEEVVGAHAAIGDFLGQLGAAGIDARFALVAAKGTSEIRRDFTTDRDEIVQAVEGLTGSLGDRRRSLGVDSLGVATRNASDGDGETLSPFRAGAHRVVVSVADAPALVPAADADAGRTVDDLAALGAAFGPFTLVEIADVPSGFDGALDSLFTPAHGGAFLERTGTNPDAFASLLTDAVSGLLTRTYAATYAREQAKPADRSIGMTVEDPDEGSLSATRTFGTTR